MKWLLVVLLVTVSTPGLEKGLGMMCPGAALAVVHATAFKLSQERSTPPGEWCQRPEQRMPRGAHACDCHKHDCTDPDPDHVSAHTDPMCLNYCTTANCACAHMDCK
jgi:hypothetical protein